MASADFCRPFKSPYDDSSPKAGQQISQGKTRDFPPIYPSHIRQLASEWLRASSLHALSPSGCRLVCDSCTSDQEFAFRFLRIPPRGGHPCSSARSSRHQGLHRDLHPTSRIPGRFR